MRAQTLVAGMQEDRRASLNEATLIIAASAREARLRDFLAQADAIEDDQASEPRLLRVTSAATRNIVCTNYCPSFSPKSTPPLRIKRRIRRSKPISEVRGAGLRFGPAANPTSAVQPQANCVPVCGNATGA
ncbi:MAG TPA: hypothetical protein VI759_05995 [Dehalococcoidia bacterium]|nr:hypothetical protein [Dehalococcoidia bacterium]